MGDGARGASDWDYFARSVGIPRSPLVPPYVEDKLEYSLRGDFGLQTGAQDLRECLLTGRARPLRGLNFDDAGGFSRSEGMTGCPPEQRMGPWRVRFRLWEGWKGLPFVMRAYCCRKLSSR